MRLLLPSRLLFLLRWIVVCCVPSVNYDRCSRGDLYGIKTDYLWREVLARDSLTHILENYAQVVESRDERTGRKTRTQIWPRYHQLDVVRRLLAGAAAHGAGRRYLIQHSAGSGKSNSIAWLAHQPAVRLGRFACSSLLAMT